MPEVSTFSVIAVSPCQAPRKSNAERWCSYIVANQYTSIEGKTPGSPEDARFHARELASELNRRAQCGYSIWARRKTGASGKTH